jgi:hypothetical protein
MNIKREAAKHLPESTLAMIKEGIQLPGCSKRWLIPQHFRGFIQCTYKKKNKKTLLFFPETHYTVV